MELPRPVSRDGLLELAPGRAAGLELRPLSLEQRRQLLGGRRM